MIGECFASRCPPCWSASPWLSGACGGEDGKTPSDQLVRLGYQGRLDFRLDEGNDPASVLQLDETTVIRRNGGGNRTSAAFDGSRPFRVRQTELDRLEEALGGLDLQDLEARFGADERVTSKTTLSYDGTTVVLGDRINEVNHGEGNEQAERFFDVESTIERLSWRAFPASIKRANRLAVQQAERLTHRLNRRPRRRQTCDRARRFVRSLRKQLSPDRKREIYSRVRPSEQPCP
jgi:hypothetical protein